MLRIFFIVIGALGLTAYLLAKLAFNSQESEEYVKKHPNCEEIPNHAEEQILLKCIWNLESPSDFPDFIHNHASNSPLLNMVKFLSERYQEEYPLRVSKVFFQHNLNTETLEISGNAIHLLKSKNSGFINLQTNRKFPDSLPIFKAPMRGSMVPENQRGRQSENGRRIFQNRFRGIGEAPVNAVLSGRILEIDSSNALISITIYHGENIYSKTLGLGKLNDGLQVGAMVGDSTALGFLPPQDSAYLYLEITKNGKYLMLPSNKSND